MSNKLKSACILAAFVLAFGAGASSAEFLLETHLSGDQCVPASTSTAAGVANLIVDAAYTQASYTLNFAGLDTDQIGAAFVRAIPGGEILEMLLELPMGSPISGVWILSPAAVEAIMAEEIAVVVFSEGFDEGGDIRGDFAETMVEVDMTTWSDVKTLFR